MNLPKDLYTPEEQEMMRLPFRTSSRIQSMSKGGKSIGASCNFFSIDDSISSIGDSFKWATEVLYVEGAPSLDLSNLRPKGSKVNGGGTASGAVSFGRIHDSIIGQMRRVEKKNGAGIVGLDYNHPELQDFLQEPFKNAYKMVYLPMHDTPEANLLLEDSASVELLAKAYDEFKCFLVKRPLPLADGTELGINLCTEVEIPHKGFCILGALNLSYFTPDNVYWLPRYFALAMRRMVEYEAQARAASFVNGTLSCESPANKQVGLGIYGLASMLGAWGVSYEEFNEALTFYGVRERHHLSIGDLLSLALEHPAKTLAQVFARELITGYYEASKIAHNAGLRAAFCIQPTVSTSQRSLDAHGYNVSPEVQPVDGIKHEGGVNYIRKSAVKGDSVQICHPGTWTLDEVPYNTYALTSSLLQQLMDSTGLGHRHSHCFYGERFTTADFKAFYLGETRHRKSLYYRLPFTNNTASLRKDTLWQEVEEGELYAGSIDNLLASCGLQQAGQIDCDCTM
jgi:Ribonucleotide reductase, barrel domain